MTCTLCCQNETTTYPAVCNACVAAENEAEPRAVAAVHDGEYSVEKHSELYG
jgi:hypothetical protein